MIVVVISAACETRATVITITIVRIWATAIVMAFVSFTVTVIRAMTTGRLSMLIIIAQVTLIVTGTFV